MASSGSFTNLYSSTNRVKLGFGWHTVERSVEDNTTTIGAYAILEAYTNLSSVRWTYNITVDTKKQSGSATSTFQNGGSYYIMSSDGIGTVTFDPVVVPHDADGTKTLDISFTFNFGSVGGTVSYSASVELDSIGRNAILLTATDFTDEENPVITYENPAGSAATLAAAISIDGTTATIPYRTISATGTSYTFSLSTAQRNTLRRAVTTGDHRAVHFLLRTTIGSYQNVASLNKTMTLVNHTPVISPTITDTNALTTKLTGNNKKFIVDFSNAYFNAGTVVRKQATLEVFSTVCGTQIFDNNETTGTVNSMDSDTFYFAATDSRGYSIRQTTVVDTIPYVKLTCNLKSSELDNNGNLTFTIGGNYFNSSFGAVTNSLEFEYALRVNDGDITWRIMRATPTFSGNTYSLTYTIAGLDHESDYTLTINAIDELMSIQSVPKKVGSISIFDWSKNDFKHNTDVYIEQSKVLRSYNTEGTDIEVLNVCDDNDNLSIGQGNYENYNGGTKIYGNKITLNSNSAIEIDSNLRFDNGRNITGLNAGGAEIIALEPCNTSGNTVLGAGNYNAKTGATNIYGNNISLTSNGDITLNGRAYGTNKILFSSSGSHMGSGQSAYLNEAISEQPNGIVIVFSYYDVDTATSKNHSWNCHFIPKNLLSLDVDGGYSFLMGINAGFSAMGAKYLYIYDTYLSGHSGNTSYGTNSGITYDNRNYVLRYVIGV